MYSADTYINAANLIAKEDLTIREAARRSGVSKSVLHVFLTKELQNENFVLADEVREKLAEHLATRHLRGGESTKRKYEAMSRGIKGGAYNG